MQDERLRETTIETRVVHAGHYLRVRSDTIVDPAGKRHTRDWVEHPGAVAIVALDEGDVLMVLQYRTPVGQVLAEIPAGTLDRMPDGSIEDPDIAAPRELGEETGFVARTWRRLGRFYTAPGFASELMHLYLATDLSPIPDYSGPDIDEHLALQRIPWREAVAMAGAGEITDAKTLLGLMWLERLVDAGEVSP
jgi:ADP-ribose pyrophosphatase